ncbi:MAG: nuclear transport factor 2 family protein [Cyanobacteria bacterium J06631_2]
MTATNIDQAVLSQSEIEISTPSIINYFQTINQEKFSDTAALFADNGVLLAPFEQPITGRKAIALYLEREASGMQLLPLRETVTTDDTEAQQIIIKGKVKTALFSVNVAWHFSLDRQQQITTVKIKLLASPQELLGLQRAKTENN